MWECVCSTRSQAVSPMEPGRMRLFQPLTRYRACVAGRVSDGARQSVGMLLWMRFSLGYFLFSGADSLYLINFSGARDLRFKACKAGRIRLLQPFTHCRANVAGRVSDGARQSVDRRMICQMVGVLWGFWIIWVVWIVRIIWMVRIIRIIKVWELS